MQKIIEELANYNILQGLHCAHKEVRHFCSYCTIFIGENNSYQCS